MRKNAQGRIGGKTPRCGELGRPSHFSAARSAWTGQPPGRQEKEQGFGDRVSTNQGPALVVSLTHFAGFTLVGANWALRSSACVDQGR